MKSTLKMRSRKQIESFSKKLIKETKVHFIDIIVKWANWVIEFEFGIQNRHGYFIFAYALDKGRSK